MMKRYATTETYTETKWDFIDRYILVKTWLFWYEDLKELEILTLKTMVKK